MSYHQFYKLFPPDCLKALLNFSAVRSSVSFFVLFINFLFGIAHGRLNWLPVISPVYIRYALSYRMEASRLSGV